MARPFADESLNESVYFHFFSVFKTFDSFVVTISKPLVVDKYERETKIFIEVFGDFSNNNSVHQSYNSIESSLLERCSF